MIFSPRRRLEVKTAWPRAVGGLLVGCLYSFYSCGHSARDGEGGPRRGTVDSGILGTLGEHRQVLIAQEKPSARGRLAGLVEALDTPRVMGWGMGEAASGVRPRQEFKDRPSTDLKKLQDSPSLTLRGQILSSQILRRSYCWRKEEEAVFPHPHAPWMIKREPT